jgi:uncharacterized alpha-E superfamily protein
MLSRLAESFFWLSRNVERAETVARVLDVTYTRSMDLYAGGAWSQRSWRTAIAISTFAHPDAVTLGESAATEALERCIFDEQNPSSIVSCIATARGNAIGLRAELSTELWEHINELYLDVRAQDLASVLEEGPSRMLRRVRDRCQAIAGVTAATLLHEDGWNFMQLGRFIERGALTTRILSTAESLDDPWPEWQRLLEMCCASFPFARVARHLQSPRDAAAFIVFRATFPRSLNFCANEIHAALHRLSETSARSYTDDAEKRAGRLCSTFNFADADDLFAEGLHPFAQRTLGTFDSLVSAIQRVYFPRTPVAAAALAV